MEIIDYALPTMMAEKALKDLHNAFLEGDLQKAAQKALEAIEQCGLAYAALKHAECKKATHP
jgi:hypothetical protein